MTASPRAWHGFWSDPMGEWIIVRGLQIALYLIGGLLGGPLH